MKPGRIIIYPKDIAIITGKTERQARTILDRVRRKCMKAPDQYVTIAEFCVVMGLPEEKIIAIIL